MHHSAVRFPLKIVFYLWIGLRSLHQHLSCHGRHFCRLQHTEMFTEPLDWRVHPYITTRTSSHARPGPQWVHSGLPVQRHRNTTVVPATTRSSTRELSNSVNDRPLTSATAQIAVKILPGSCNNGSTIS